jgi:hypothetical protein
MNASQTLQPPQVPQKRIALNECSEFFSESQVRALTELNHYAEVFLNSKGARYAGLAPRTKVLLLGGTGSGKTCVARSFARSRGWNFFSVDCSAWVPLGAYTKPSTLQVIRDFVRKNENDRAVILLDEIDKLLPAGNQALQSSWTTSLFGEVLCALDIDERLIGHDWTLEDIEKFKTRCFVIGAGAFEFYLREAKQKANGGVLGFGTGHQQPDSFAQYLATSQAIPDEVSSRFASPPVFLDSPTPDDFETVIQEIHEHLGLPFEGQMKEMVEEAQTSLGGMRWAENYLTRLLVQHPEAARRQKRDEESKVVERPPEYRREKTYDFFAPDTTEHVRKLNEDVFGLNLLLIRITSAISIAESEGRISQDQNDRLRRYLHDDEPFVEIINRALRVTDMCSVVSPDPSHNQPIHDWTIRVLAGLQNFSPELAKSGLLELWYQAWDLCNRVNQRRACLSNAVAAGRYRS